MDDNTTKILLVAIPSAAFIAIIALVIFGLSPGECIEIEVPGGGKITKCKPELPEGASLSAVQSELIEKQIRELDTHLADHYQERITTLKERQLIDAGNFTEPLVNATFDSLTQQVMLLSSEEANRFSEKISSYEIKLGKLDNVAEEIMQKNDFLLAGQWSVEGAVGAFGLQYHGKFIFNPDGTYESDGKLDGKNASGTGTYKIDKMLGTLALYTSSSTHATYYFADVSSDSFTIWSPQEIAELKFSRIA